jgi:RNA polymerase-binding transcription factor DksA
MNSRHDTPHAPPGRRCQLCDAPIAPERIEALPGVTTCIDCARKHPRKVDTSMIELSEASRINKNGFAPRED